MNIKKTYTTGNTTVEALQGVSLEFRRQEFVAILGASGCGKTTMLNIIGGLDHYTSGDLIIDKVSTKDYKDKDWDAYRNNCVGFIFQSYNLIGHINILTNVEMSMTLSGYSKAARKQKALEALQRVGLKDQAYKKPNQLSGGQMQRVAIARALVNDPQIILADEPTGALDSKTSVQIMDLIKEIASEKLVIMVTHNPDLAKNYANRIIEIKDGEILSDSNPVQENEMELERIQIKKTAMSYLSALYLSFHNIMTKKGRTFLTAFASSIGIIGIALILALSNGFQKQIEIFERDSLSQMPITISQQMMQMDTDTMLQFGSGDTKSYLPEYTSEQVVTPLASYGAEAIHTNKITEAFMDYIKEIDDTLVGCISYARSTRINAITKTEDGRYEAIETSQGMTQWTVYPDAVQGDMNNIMTENHDILMGHIDTTKPGLILIVDAQNRVDENTLKSLGFDITKHISFADLMNKEIKIVFNDDFYQQQNEVFTINHDYEALYNHEGGITVKIQAILRGKEDKKMITNGTGIAYTSALTERIINENKDSNIVRMQKEVKYHILSGKPFDTEENTREEALSYLGADTQPEAIYICPKDFDAKDKILTYLDAYNDGKTKEEVILYNDMADMISSLSGNIMGAITLVLIAFSAISLIVSCIMIGIITYISVLERTKEIGVLRSLGARKKDISRVFNAETLLIGICSGLLGIGFAQLLTIPANAIIAQLTGLSNVASLHPLHAIILLIVSVSLTLLGGCIPAKIASKKDPVTALRTE